MSGTASEPATSAPASEPADRPEDAGFGALLGLLWDVGLPLVGYYALHLMGYSDWIALLVATLAAGVRLVWVAVRSRKITWFAAVMLAVFGLGLALAFVSDDPRFLLLSDSFSTGVVALGFAGSLLFGKPLTLSAFQTWKPHDAARMDEYYRTNPVVRSSFRTSSLVWAIGLTVLAVVRVPLVYTIPIPIMVGLSTAMLIATVTALAVWNGIQGARTGKRARAWAEQHGALAV